MNLVDYVVLLGVILGITGFGIWSTRRNKDLRTFLKGAAHTPWLTIGLSVMATQASAITFLSTPGQGYESGVGFVQNYFGAPLALMIIAAVFLPIYRRLNVYTAYEYLGRRFDAKTRLLGAILFLIQRGLGAGITIYAPAIVLSTVLGWRLDVTIVASGLLVIAYTVSGGSAAVNLTQKYQMAVIFAGMLAAFVILLTRLSSTIGLPAAFAVAGNFHKLEAVDFSLDPNRRYTLWTGLLGGLFLALSYFGTDQSQVQRYLSGSSLRESRLGLMFNAVFKIPMQFLILLLGSLLFVFYQLEPAPVFFNRPAWQQQAAGPQGQKLRALAADFQTAHDDEARALQALVAARQKGDSASAEHARAEAGAAQARAASARQATKETLAQGDPHLVTNDTDYVFITFVLDQLPHGLIGLLVAVIFAATFSSKAAELNALASTSTVDVYRHLVRRDAGDAHYLVATKWLTAFWGLVAIAFALFAHLVENLIQATNIVGSIFYGVVLGMFLTAFFCRRVGGTAVFWAALAGQILVFALYARLNISYLWYNVIGCAACMGLSLLLQLFLPAPPRESTT
ncbi:MAG TPA: sodium:solute symporter [Candidatus Didemnitutus sp.]|nr:sodium:solute symporter [Candidatus Didemnitutus sp.]